MIFISLQLLYFYTNTGILLLEAFYLGLELLSKSIYMVNSFYDITFKKLDIFFVHWFKSRL